MQYFLTYPQAVRRNFLQEKIEITNWDYNPITGGKHAYRKWKTI